MPDSYTQPVLSESCLLTVDVQNDFVLPGAVAEIPGTHEKIPVMRRLLDGFRDADRPIVHVVRLYQSDGSNVDPCRRGAIENGAAIVRPDSDGAELVDELKPSSSVQLDSGTLLDGKMQSIGPSEWVIYKPRWGAFYRTPLDDHLREFGVNTIVVVGCNFPNCPRTTVYEASERDYRIVLVEDAVSGLYERGKKELENIGVRVWTGEECLKRMEERVD